MRRTHAEYAELFDQISPPVAFMVTLEPDWDSLDPQDREISVTSRGALDFIDDVQGLERPPEDWDDRVQMTYSDGTVYLRKANPFVFTPEELDEEAAETEQAIAALLERDPISPECGVRDVIVDDSTVRLSVYVSRTADSDAHDIRYLAEVTRPVALQLVDDAERNGDRVELETAGVGSYRLVVKAN